ncbi:hypothetical protein TMatcc_010462 [Talaromyces marneffei ATCC 18224]|uniref:Uncharacterized protein n=1 Tax=Talaromyces marneffei PM1 TaxID=1077442 RepID=A0A093VJC1_TALMA|nr:uncharacterized protein EYB26_009747 [Talaromyces marneffei]QGA22033.1 hypothetical protein EYB26_009747 [Talaromyces marneffei]
MFMLLLAGGGYTATPLQDISTEDLRQIMTVNFEWNFWAYRATIPYLLNQNDTRSTWTLCTGSQGDLGARAAPAMTQGALYSMANVACRDNYKTNVRFNEIYLALRVEVDESAAKNDTMKASDFAKCYAALLSDPGVRSSRVSVFGYDDLEKLKYETKVQL